MTANGINGPHLLIRNNGMNGHMNDPTTTHLLNDNLRSTSKKIALNLLGGLCIVLAVIGVFLPVMPTTVFVLSAAWCFSRSNQRCYQWLLNHKLFGQCIRGWQEGKAIPKKAFQKIMLILWFGLSASSLLTVAPWIDLLLLAVGVCVSSYLWRKSEYFRLSPP